MTIYRLLLRLYPADFRARFEREMISAREELGGGAKEVAGLLSGAVREWFAKLETSQARRARWFADWRCMRPAGLAREEYFGPEPADLRDAQRRIDFCVARIVDAIAHHQFEQARYYSAEDLKAREHLRRVREKYGLA